MTSVKNAIAIHEQNPHMARAQADVDLATAHRLLASSSLAAALHKQLSFVLDY